MTLEIRALASGNTNGISVHGVTESALEDAAVRSQLKTLWVEHGVMVGLNRNWWLVSP